MSGGIVTGLGLHQTRAMQTISARLRRAVPALTVLAVAAAPMAALGLTTPERDPSSAERDLPMGVFAVVCTFSHARNDDPVVYPNRPGASHRHDFFGNTELDAYSTGDSMLGQGTTCSRPLDSAGYWAPTLYAGGKRVRPKHMKIYYQSYETSGAVETMPTGLSIIAGDREADSPQDRYRQWFSCAEGDSSTVPPSDTPPSSCPPGSDFMISFRLPSCWDGHTLNGADQTNVVYDDGPGSHRCPLDHPHRIPELVQHLHYDPPADMANLTLAYGAGRGSIHTAHSDFFNGWDPAELRRLIDRCLNDGYRRCGAQPGKP